MSSWGDEAGVVELPDGIRIRGVSRHKRGDLPPPDFTVYLLGRDPGSAGWPYRWVKWPDFRLPSSMDDTIEALRDAHSRAAHERVEISCDGGVGRTGTALGVLAVIAGVAPEDAVAWVRERYCPKAVETGAQERWVMRAAAALRQAQ